MLSCLKRSFCCFSKKVKNPKQSVYVLKLENDKYYVGESTNVKKRIWAHKNENGSAWTKKYGVEKQIEGVEVKNNFYELAQTLEMMRVYGIDNVRGSLFTKPFPLDRFEKIMAAQLYCELHGYCRKCGSNDHFVGNCKEETVVDWVHQFGGELEYKELLVPKKRECSNCSKDISKMPYNYRYCRDCFLKINGYH
jgi:predicted GIY-YIG superfamily endonuclease